MLALRRSATASLEDSTVRPTRRTLGFGAVALVLGACIIASGAVAWAEAHRVPDTGAKMLDAARSFLGSLTAEQRESGSWELDAEQRFDWHFVPRERYGVRLKDMTVEQRELLPTPTS